MGNKNSAISKAHGSQIAKVASIEPHYVISMERKLSAKPDLVSLRVHPTEKQGEVPLCDDDTFSNYIQRTKYKIRSMSNNGFLEEQRYPTHADVANGTDNKENERDPYSDFIQNSRNKFRTRTLSRNNSSFRRG
ncbi:hypothetical protein Fmac_020358 [Flemingia macrophylla]|uniref:Uncharacterized protein n=1 Tax=Flemingia macrophylla TaxID=520843 RepID=A0ABD1LTY0_9FABA